MLDNILGLAEVAQLVGLERSTLKVYKSQGNMPKPDRLVDAGRIPLWTVDTILDWDATRKR